MPAPNINMAKKYIILKLIKVGCPMIKTLFLKYEHSAL